MTKRMDREALSIQPGQARILFHGLRNDIAPQWLAPPLWQVPRTRKHITIRCHPCHSATCHKIRINRELCQRWQLCHIFLACFAFAKPPVLEALASCSITLHKCCFLDVSPFQVEDLRASPSRPKIREEKRPITQS